MWKSLQRLSSSVLNEQQQQLEADGAGWHKLIEVGWPLSNCVWPEPDLSSHNRDQFPTKIIVMSLLKPPMNFPDVI